MAYRSRLYRIWTNMKSRCYNPKIPTYHYYGGRGIKVCDEWLHDFQAFRDWSMLNGYQDKLSIDRIDNDGDYSPTNCRWVNQSIQMRNSSHARNLTYNGETHCIREWSEITGLNENCIINRIKCGWTTEDTLTKPVGFNQGGSIETNPRKKKTMCVETGIIYRSAREAARKNGLCGSTISECCRKPYLTAKGFHWKYIEDYGDE